MRLIKYIKMLHGDVMLYDARGEFVRVGTEDSMKDDANPNMQPIKKRGRSSHLKYKNTLWLFGDAH